ncbi:MAG: recombinase family protein [Opitutales bacterium]
MLHDHQAMKAITIARVSTDEQLEYSPAAQSARMREYCERKGLEILESHEISESSTRGERKGFMRIIDDASKKAIKLKEPVAIVTDKVDRLQRGFKQQPILEKYREDGLLEYHFSSDNCIIHKRSPAKDLFMWNIAVSLAQNYTDSLRDNVNRAKEEKLARGEWISQAPIGYLNQRDDSCKRHGRGRAEIIVDPERAPLVKQLFERYATGCYSIFQLVKFSKEIGLTNSRGKKGHLTKSHVHKILNNPFYHGVMRLRSTGEEFPHIHEALISKSLFDQCQAVMKAKGSPHGRYGRKEFLFRGLVTCAKTGKLCTAQEHKRKYENGNVASFVYLTSYSADDPKKIYYVREEAVLDQVVDALSTLTIADPDDLKNTLSYISKAYSKERQGHREQTVSLRRESGDLERKLDRLTDLRLEGELNAAEFMSQKKRVQDRQRAIAELLEAHHITDDGFTQKISQIVELASNARKTFENSSFEQKRELLSLVFQNLQLEEKKLVFSMNKPFDTIAECAKTGEWCTLVDVIRTCGDTRNVIINMNDYDWEGLLAA